jgi:hypothetical protein
MSIEWNEQHVDRDGRMETATGYLTLEGNDTAMENGKEAIVEYKLDDRQISKIQCLPAVGRTKWQTCGEAMSLHDLKMLKEDLWRTVLQSSLISLSIDNRLY